LKKLLGFSFLCVLFFQQSFAGETFHDTDSSKIKAKIRGEKFSKGFQKGLWFLNYLNYSDSRKKRNDSVCTDYNCFEGRLIRKIEARVLSPFGTDVDNLEKKPTTSAQKLGNGIHFKTRQWVVKMDLLVHEGEVLNPQLLFDSERLLWEESNYKNIKFILTPVGETEVDILVLIQDRWGFSIESAVEFNRIKVGLRFSNILGTPQELRTYIALNYNAGNLYTIFGSYRYRNILKSRVDFSLDYTYEKNTRQIRPTLRRNYFSSEAKWAGYADFNVSDYKSGLPDKQNNPIGNITSLNHDYWISSAVPVKTNNPKLAGLRLVLSARATINNFLKRPFVHNDNYTETFLNGYKSLGSIGFSQWSFQQEKNLYYLDINEYIAKGLSVALIAGTTSDEDFDQRFYSGFYFNYGLPLKKAGFINLNTTYGGYLHNDFYDQFSWRVRAHYFTNSYKVGKAFFRQFFNFSSIMSFNRPAQKQLDLNGQVIGLSTTKYKGNHSFSFRIEEDFYANFKVLGFSSCVYIFANMGVISKNDIRPFTSVETAQIVGFGLRLRNVNVGMGFIDLSFGYYPSLPKELKQTYFGTNFFNPNQAGVTNLFSANYLNLDL
jgi:hypothetical protein